MSAPLLQRNSAAQVFWCWHIKLRKTGDKTFCFLSGKGGLNRLRIHAAQFRQESDAQSVLAQILEDNPDYEGKVVAA